MKDRFARLPALALLVPVVPRRVLDDLVLDALLFLCDLVVVARAPHDAFDAATTGPGRRGSSLAALRAAELVAIPLAQGKMSTGSKRS
jgi:hypothetical protein